MTYDIACNKEVSVLERVKEMFKVYILYVQHVLYMILYVI